MTEWMSSILEPWSLSYVLATLGKKLVLVNTEFQFYL